MHMQRALEVAAATSELEMRRGYRRAVADGARNTGCTPDRERDYGALRLLTLATLRMSDLVLFAGSRTCTRTGRTGADSRAPGC